MAKWSDILTPTQRTSFNQWITQNESAVRGLNIDSQEMYLRSATGIYYLSKKPYGKITLCVS